MIRSCSQSYLPPGCEPEPVIDEGMDNNPNLQGRRVIWGFDEEQVRTIIAVFFLALARGLIIQLRS